MCGIFGVFNIESNQELKQEDILSALCEMKHRGPDAEGVKIFNSNAAISHIRLSIIDLDSKSNQPFNIGERYWITYNGEIYNYIELREELEKKGHLFKTNSDTEVLLNSYLEWGQDCVKKFNGMWAFAVYDVLNNELFCSRDRFGVKPFNYTYFNGQFIFSSEIKSILKFCPELNVPNYEVIANYIQISLGAQLEDTWFENIKRLPPAHNLKVTSNGIVIDRYWDYPKKINKSITFEQAVTDYKKLFLSAVELRMRSDVPVGLTLSSGLDSTSIICVENSINNGITHTYTACFPDVSFEKSEKANFSHNVSINEPHLVSKLANELNFSPTFVNIDYKEYVNKLQKLIWHLESGHGSPAIFPLDQILAEAKKDVTVVLEGQGADELLAGYISNVMPHYIYSLLKKLYLKRAFSEFKKFAKTYSVLTAIKLFIRTSEFLWLKKLFYSFSGMNKLLMGPLRNRRLKNDYPITPSGFDDYINEQLFKSHTGGLVNLLHYGDAISMAHSLESRLPFMDYRLVEFVFTLPPDYKIKLGLGKYIHRSAMDKLVPKFILKSPIKFGFESPLKHIFIKNSDNTARKILFSNEFNDRGLFSKKMIEKYFKEMDNNQRDNSRVLYRILSVELWFRVFIDKKV